MPLFYPGNHPPAETQFLGTQSVFELKAEQPISRANVGFYFTITDPTAIVFSTEVPKAQGSLTIFSEFSIGKSQLQLIDLAQKMFKGSRSLEGEALEILRFTSRRMQSKTPSHLS